MIGALRRRRRLPSPAPRSNAASSTAGRVAGAVGRRVPGRLRAAGDDDALAGRRALFALGGFAAGATARGGMNAPVAAALLGGLGWHVAGLAHARAARAREAEVRDALPDALDLLVVCAVAGMGIDPALRLVASESRGALGEAFGAGIAALDVGMSRDDAYRAFAQRAAAPDATRMVAALRRAERYGAPLARTLREMAAEARDRSRAAARERAMAAPVRMLFPLTLCFLPAFVLLAVAPSLLVALRSFKG